MGVGGSTQKLEKEDKDEKEDIDKWKKMTQEEKDFILKHFIITIKLYRTLSGNLRESFYVNVDLKNPDVEKIDQLIDYLNSPKLEIINIEYYYIQNMPAEERQLAMDALYVGRDSVKFFQEIFEEFSKKIIAGKTIDTRSDSRKKLFLTVDSNVPLQFKETFARSIHDTLKAYDYNKDNVLISRRPVAEVYMADGKVEPNNPLNQDYLQYPSKIHVMVHEMFVEDDKLEEEKDDWKKLTQAEKDIILKYFIITIKPHMGIGGGLRQRTNVDIDLKNPNALKITEIAKYLR